MKKRGYLLTQADTPSARVRFAIWKAAKSTAYFCKFPADGGAPGEPSQWLAAKFPMRPNSETKFAVTGK
jgi:hypothetical protein